jgi:hypothetical protein
MSQAETQLIVPRRNFLIRALGFTAAGATMAIPIVTLADARSRIDHHAKELEKAWRDYYPAEHDAAYANNSLRFPLLTIGRANLINTCPPSASSPAKNSRAKGRHDHENHQHSPRLRHVGRNSNRGWEKIQMVLSAQIAVRHDRGRRVHP